jgi:cytochrome oxidase Cu insertion factor (SCO1/SenC/PrrC family)
MTANFIFEEKFMKKIFISFLLLLVFVCVSFAQGNTSAPAPKATPEPKLKVGDLAPDFELVDTTRKKVKLSDFKGKKNVVLAFYVLAFTGG